MRYAMLYSVLAVSVLCAAAVLATAPHAFAATPQSEGEIVVNRISASASTGGNVANVLKEGKARAEVFIRTVVNGEVVEEVDERVKSAGGGRVLLKGETHFGNSTVEGESVEIETEAHIKTETSVQGEAATEEQSDAPVETNQKTNEDKPQENEGNKTSSFSAFVQRLVNYVVSIFS